MKVIRLFDARKEPLTGEEIKRLNGMVRTFFGASSIDIILSQAEDPDALRAECERIKPDFIIMQSGAREVDLCLVSYQAYTQGRFPMAN